MNFKIKYLDAISTYIHSIADLLYIQHVIDTKKIIQQTNKTYAKKNFARQNYINIHF